MDPSFIRTKGETVGVVLVKYKSLIAPTEFTKNTEVKSVIKLVVKVLDQIVIYHESTTKIIKPSDLTETGLFNVKSYYRLDNKFYPSKSDINKGIGHALDQIKHGLFKCITSTFKYRNNLKWVEENNRKKFEEYIKKLDANKLILDVNEEFTSRTYKCTWEV